MMEILLHTALLV